MTSTWKPIPKACDAEGVETSREREEARQRREEQLIIEVPGGTLLMLGPEAVDALEVALRKHRRVDRPKRDLADQIEAFLAAGPATAPDIARAIGARDSSVRQTLQTDARFRRVPELAGRSASARLWALASGASGVGPAGGTTTRDEGQ